MFELSDNYSQTAVIKVIGIGGGGSTAVDHMMSHGIEGVDYICANTDAESIKKCSAKTMLQLGSKITKGLGAGANPNMGRLAALEDHDRIQEVLSGADMVFIAAGMGGGTGTGGAPVVAQIAKEMGILTVAVVTKPFPFEGEKRSEIALVGIAELQAIVDSLITIPTEKLQSVLSDKSSLLDAYKAANDVMLGAVKSIAELITRPGLINVDFADVRTVMSEMGMGMIGSGRATGEDRAHVASEAALASPLLEGINLTEAKGVLVNVTAGLDMSIGEFEEVGNTIKKSASINSTIVVGTVIDPELTGELYVTVVFTGLAQFDKEGARYSRRESSKYEGAEKNSIDSTIDVSDYLEVPEFLRRENATKDKIDGDLTDTSIHFIAPGETNPETLAKIIQLLSKAYESVGGDSLVIHKVSPLPPRGKKQSKTAELRTRGRRYG